MEDIKNFINIYWIMPQKASEEIISYLILENKQKIEFPPIYISKEIKQNYIFSVFMYTSEKKNQEICFYSEYSFDKSIKYNKKIFLELENKMMKIYFYMILFILKKFLTKYNSNYISK